MNIVLMGYRGTGKSTVAGILSQRLKRKLYTIDALIVKSAGMPIARIVGEWGWPRFREIESSVVREISAEAAVIDCGGGVVLEPRNVAHLQRAGKIVLLTAGFKTILNRIHKDPNRPPLKDGLSFAEEQRQVLAEREPKYRAAADLVCDTTQVSPQETAAEIIGLFKKKSWL